MAEFVSEQRSMLMLINKRERASASQLNITTILYKSVLASSVTCIKIHIKFN